VYQVLDAATPPTGGTGNVVYTWHMLRAEEGGGHSLLTGHLQPAAATAGTTLGHVVASPGTLAFGLFGPTYAGLLSYARRRAES